MVIYKIATVGHYHLEFQISTIFLHKICPHLKPRSQQHSIFCIKCRFKSHLPARL